MTRISSKASWLFEFIDFCLSGMLANVHKYFNLFPSEISIENLACIVSFVRQYILEAAHIMCLERSGVYVCADLFYSFQRIRFPILIKWTSPFPI